MIESNLLTYKTVRAALDVKSNSAIKKAIKAGLLIRVCVGSGANSYRITADSLRSFLTSRSRHNDADEKAYLAKAAARTAKMKAAKRLPLPRLDEDVLLDPADAIENYNAGRRALRPPVEKPTLDEVIQAVPQVTARPDWRERNRWLEGGCVGPDPWASKPSV